jgi:hypothetical protein
VYTFVTEDDLLGCTLECTDREGGVKRKCFFLKDEAALMATLLEDMPYRRYDCSPFCVPDGLDFKMYPFQLIFVGDLTQDIYMVQSIFFSNGQVLDAHYGGFRPTATEGNDHAHAHLHTA